MTTKLRFGCITENVLGEARSNSPSYSRANLGTYTCRWDVSNHCSKISHVSPSCTVALTLNVFILMCIIHVHITASLSCGRNFVCSIKFVIRFYKRSFPLLVIICMLSTVLVLGLVDVHNYCCVSLLSILELAKKNPPSSDIVLFMKSILIFSHGLT